MVRLGLEGSKVVKQWGWKRHMEEEFSARGLVEAVAKRVTSQ